MKTLRIQPAAGRVVRDPDLLDLITAPRTVVDTPFWRRRIRDGDVTLDTSTADPPATASQAADVAAPRSSATRASTTPKTSG